MASATTSRRVAGAGIALAGHRCSDNGWLGLPATWSRAFSIAPAEKPTMPIRRYDLPFARALRISAKAAREGLSALRARHPRLGRPRRTGRDA